MATEFLTAISDGDYMLTSRLDTIRARTDKPKVPVRVIRDPDGDVDEFFSTTLYPFNGIVELSAIGKLIEERFRSLGRTVDMMSVEVDGVALDFTAFYCTHMLNSDFDCRGCFWTKAATAIVHRSSMVCLSHFDTGSTTYHVKVVGVNPDGSVGMVEKDFQRSPYSDYLSFSVDDIIRYGLNQTADDTGGDLVKVSYFAVSYGEIQKIFYVVDDPYFLTFRFKNLFNCTEYVDVVGKVKRKTAISRDIALCGGTSRHYNQVVNLTYEVETGPLTHDQALTLEDLFSSYEVQLMTAPDDYDILITDHTCEVDNDDDNLTTMKFSFRFVGDRSVLLDAEMDALAPSVTHIFSQEFTAEFA